MGKLTVPQGAFQLARYPQRKNDPLRAWDAADEYLLHHLYEENLLDARTSILILNDLFGALSVALTDYRPQLISDSYISHQGTRANLIRNDLSTGQVRLLNSLQDPDVTFDVVLIKIPRSLAFLEDQLHRLRACLSLLPFHLGPRNYATTPGGTPLALGTWPSNGLAFGFPKHRHKPRWAVFGHHPIQKGWKLGHSGFNDIIGGSKGIIVGGFGRYSRPRASCFRRTCSTPTSRPDERSCRRCAACRIRCGA